MKALTNILTHMLMLLMMAALATCTTDDGADEVMPMDDGMVQLQVGMSVPNLKITTRAADEGESLSAIKGLCYDEDGTLTKIADATDITSTTFNMRVPVETRIIHFLANLPDDCTLPKVWTTTETDLQNLTTQSENMTYWGCTTFDATPTDCSITFYRNKARISIETAEGASVGTVGIAGVVNAYDTGKLVPYGGAYNFDLSTNDYPTVPTEGFSKSNVMMNTDPLPTQYDVFEHPNTGTSQENSLYAICLIGSKYYKVALGTPDEDGMVTGNYFQIIRNHNYVISVADVDDVDAALGADFAEDAASLAPINDPNISVKDVVDVVVTLSTSTETLDYNNTSISNLVLSVTVPPEVNTLTLNTPGFTIVTYTDTNIPDTDTKYLVDKGNGSFTVNHPENDEEHTFSFRLQLTDKSRQSYTLSCIAASNDTNVKITQPAEISVSLNKVDDNDNVYWMGASTLDYFDSATKIPIPAEKLTKGATVTFEYEKGSNPSLSFQHASWADFENASTLELSQNTTSFEITEELYNEIQEKKGYVYNVADIGMVVQGGEITLKKITIEPAQVENVALTVDPTTTSLYYDSNNTQQITVTVSDDKTLTSLTITPSVDCFTITPATGELTGPTDGVYTYAPDGGVTSVTFTIAPSDSYNFTSDLTSVNIVFGGSGENMSVTTAQTAVTLSAVPTVAFSPTNDQTIYLGGDPLTVTMTVPSGGTLNTLTITAEGFTINNTYTDTYTDETVRYGYTTVQYTFTPTGTEAANRQITFTGSGTNIKEVNRTINVAVVKPAITASADKTTLYYDKDNQTTTVTVNIPKGVSALNITAADFTVALQSGNGSITDNTYTPNDTNGQTAVFVFTMNNVSSTTGQTSTTIEFSDNGGIATSPSPITIALAEEPESVSSLVVTQVGSTTIDLGEGGNKTVNFSLAIPDQMQYLKITTNYSFDVTALEYTDPEKNGKEHYYYYITPNSVDVINLAFTMDSQIFEMIGDYEIPFYTTPGQDSEITTTTTITVINSDLEEGVLWSGEKDVANSPILLYNIFKNYVGKTLKLDIVNQGTQWRINVAGTNYQYDGEDPQPNNMTLELPITEDMVEDISISGANVTVTKLYFTE